MIIIKIFIKSINTALCLIRKNNKLCIGNNICKFLSTHRAFKGKY